MPVDTCIAVELSLFIYLYALYIYIFIYMYTCVYMNGYVDNSMYIQRHVCVF